LEFGDNGFHGLDLLNRESGLIHRRRLPLRIDSRGEAKRTVRFGNVTP